MYGCIFLLCCRICWCITKIQEADSAFVRQVVCRRWSYLHCLVIREINSEVRRVLTVLVPIVHPQMNSELDSWWRAHGTIRHRHMKNSTMDFSGHPTTILTDIGFTAVSQLPTAFFTRLPMYSPKIESSKIDGCRQFFVYFHQKQDEVLILLKCRIAASQASELPSVLLVHTRTLLQHSVLFRSSASCLARPELPCSP